MDKKDHIQSEEILYTISEAAALLKVNKNMVYYLISNGYLKSIKFGCRKVTRTALLNFLEQNDGKEIVVPQGAQNNSKE